MEVMLDRRYKSKAVKEFNILYVDDEVVNLRIFRQSFKRDYNVYVAQDGLEAIEILKTNRIDLIITDQQMPCLLYTSPSPRDRQKSRMPSSA